MLQDLLGNFVPALKKTESWTANIIGTGGCVALWGWLLYQGVVDPLGGINTLWPLFGISNQMLAGIALMLATVVLIKMKRQQYVWVTILPAAWLLICTTTAGLIKIFDSNPAVGFVALGEKYATALDAGQVLAPAKDIGQMQHVVLNAYINAGLTVLFLLVVFSVLFYAIKVGIAAWGKSERTDKETPFEPSPTPDRPRSPVRRGALTRNSPCSTTSAAWANTWASRPDAGRHARLRHLCRTHAQQAPGQAGDDLRGVLPRAPGGALRWRQGSADPLLLNPHPSAGHV